MYVNLMKDKGKIEVIELGISLLIRLLEKLFLWSEHLKRSNYSVLTVKRFLRQQQSLDRSYNLHPLTFSDE